jgi:hypothetical protein
VLTTLKKISALITGVMLSWAVQAEIISSTDYDNISVTHAQDDQGRDFLQTYILSEDGQSYLGVECGADRVLQAFVILPPGSVLASENQIINVENAQPKQFSTSASIRMLPNGTSLLLLDAYAGNPRKRPLALLQQLDPLGFIEMYFPYVDSGLSQSYSVASNNRVFNDSALFCGESL